MQQMTFIADLIACSTCFGHHYAHHQELESIINVAAACGIWCYGFQVVCMVRS
jgi:fumarate reductase subunit D